MESSEKIAVTGHGSTLAAAKMNAAKKLEGIVHGDIFLNNDMPLRMAWRPVDVYARLIETMGGIVATVEVDVDFEFTLGERE